MFDIFFVNYRLRSFVLGVTIGLRSVLSSIVKKSYYDIEMWLTPAGATLFYGIFNFVGYFIFAFRCVSHLIKKRLVLISISFSG